ncbi:tetratricopeptide repeat protein [Prosthecobacter sp.]|uniref:tetratricopeptide repeat protein n=1 Tax=Prosthecobacter sp. TaxID=1965333 RepID=UPI003785164B
MHARLPVMKPLLSCLPLLLLVLLAAPHSPAAQKKQDLASKAGEGESQDKSQGKSKDKDPGGGLPPLRQENTAADAEKAAQALVEARTQAHGPEDKETLRARLQLAQVILGQDRAADAEARLQALLPVVTRVFGAEQRETLACQSALLSATAATGKNAETEAEYRSLIATAQRVLGLADALTLQARWRFSGVLYALGKRTEAEAEDRQARDLSRGSITLKERHSIDTQTAKALKLRIDKKYSDAGHAWLKLLPEQTRLLGAEHPDTLKAQVELAENVEAQGWGAEAAQRLLSVLAVQQRVLGALHPDTLGTCSILAACLRAQNRPQEALPYARRALEGCQKVFGSGHLDTRLNQQLVDSLTPGAPTPPPAAALPQDRPVATVDGVPILASDVRKMIQTGVEEFQQKHPGEAQKLEQETARLKRSALGILIDQQLLASELPRVGITVNPLLIEQDFEAMVKNSAQGDLAAFEAMLARDGLTLEKLRKARLRLINSTAMRAHLAGTIKVTDEQVRDFYEKNRSLWDSPVEVKLYSLTVPETLHQTDTATRAHVESLREKISKGASFPAVARAESKDSHAEDGGAWGWTPVTSLSPKIRAAVATMGKASISPIIEEPGLFILIGVEDRRTPPPPPFEKVKDQVAARLKNDLANEHIEKTLVRLRAAADIQRLAPAPEETDPGKKQRARDGETRL